jgi:hypothetical protein
LKGLVLEDLGKSKKKSVSPVKFNEKLIITDINKKSTFSK